MALIRDYLYELPSGRGFARIRAYDDEYCDASREEIDRRIADMQQVAWGIFARADQREAELAATQPSTT